MPRKMNRAGLLAIIAALSAAFLTADAIAQWGSTSANPERTFLSPDDEAALIERLNLEPDEATIVSHLIEAFRDGHAHRRAMMREARSARKSLREKDLDSTQASIAMYRAAQTVFEEEFAARAQLKAELKQLVIPPEDPARAEAWRTFWRDHQRKTIDAMSPSHEAGVDLVLLWERFVEKHDAAPIPETPGPSDAPDMSDAPVAPNAPDAPDAIDAILNEYAEAIDGPLRRRNELHAERIIPYMRDMEARLDGTYHNPLQEWFESFEPHTLSTEELQALQAQVMAKSRERRIEQERPVMREALHLRRINQQYLERLTRTLPPDRAAAFRQLYFVDAYGSFFHDPAMGRPFHGHAFFKAALALDDLTPLQRQGLENLRTSYLSSFDALAQQLVKLERDSEDAWEQKIREPETYKAEFEEPRAELLAKRRALQERVMADGTDILSEQQAAMVAASAGEHAHESALRYLRW